MAGDRFVFQAAGGRRLEGVVTGADDGPLVVMHHGTPGAGVEVWPPHAEHARARGLRLAEYSRPGAGGSDRASGRTVGDCADDAASLADALGAERFYTIGGSGGGPHALACAALLGDRVIAAATIAGVAPRDAQGLDWLEGMGEENLEEFAAAERGPEALEAFIAKWVPQLRDADGPAVLAALGDLVSPPDAVALTGEYAEFAAAGMHEALRDGYWGWFDDDLALLGDWGFDLAAIAVPVTVWQGRQDRFVPAAHGEWLAEHVAGARAHLLDDHGHLSLALAHFDVILGELVESGAS